MLEYKSMHVPKQIKQKKTPSFQNPVVKELLEIRSKFELNW